MYGFTVSMTATPGTPDWKGFCDKLKTGGAVAAVSVALVMTPFSAAAISGGGKDYASKDWSGEIGIELFRFVCLSMILRFILTLFPQVRISRRVPSWGKISVGQLPGVPTSEGRT